MALIPENLEHFARALQRLLQQYKGRPNLEKVIKTVSSQVQDLETAIYDLWALRTLDGAVGAQLDQLGEAVGQLRSGQVDAVYRTRVRARILANRSSGTTPDILGVLDLLMPAPGHRLEFWDQPAAGFVVRVIDGTLTATEQVEIANFLRGIRAAGVDGILESLITGIDPDLAFQTLNWAGYIDADMPAGALALVANLYSRGPFTIGNMVPAGGGAAFVEWPEDGAVIINPNTATEETIAYASMSGGNFPLDAPTAFAHSAREPITFYDQAGAYTMGPGDGFGTTTNPAIGGKLAGARK